ncbi:MAG: prealbumin-like fold domain-containing protein, partial [Monoglobaceae bacterium]
IGWYDSDGNKVTDDMLINDGATISYTTTGDATYYARYVKTYTLDISKIDGDRSSEDNQVPVAGAEFTLYQADDSGDKTIEYNGASIKCSVVETSVTALSEDKTKASAVFKNKLIAEKEYYLVETNAPSDYLMIETPVKITIDSSGSNVLIDEASNVISENSVNIVLTNYLKLQLPVAGVTVTGIWYMAAGLILLLAAAVTLRRIRR